MGGVDETQRALTSSDLLVARLLPAVVHEVNNATQLLVGLKALLAIPGGEAMFASRADDLGRTSHRMGDLGFAMAVLATAAGADMLMARRDARSIEILWDLAVHAVQRDGGGELAVEGRPPRTRSDALDGWQLAWSAASLPVLCAAAGEPLQWSWSWQPDGTLEGVGPRDHVLEESSLASLRERTAGLGLEVEPGRVRWIPRADWLELPAGG